MPPYTTHPPLPTLDLQFLRSALHSKSAALRVDGRQPLQPRPLKFEFSALPINESGCVEASLGGTSVIAAVTADVVAPHADRPKDGMITVFVDLSPVAAAAWDGSKRSGGGSNALNDPIHTYQITLERTLHRIIRESRAIDTEALCLIAGKSVWAIRVDVHVLNAMGNVLDACVAATVAALLHYRRPDVTIVGDTLTIHTAEERQPVPLVLSHIPVSTTFAMIPYAELMQASGTAADNMSVSPATDSSDVVLITDPSSKEEAAATGLFTVITNNHGEILFMHQSGGNGLTPAQITSCIDIATEGSKPFVQTMQEAVSADVDNRLKRRARASVAQNTITV